MLPTVTSEEPYWDIKQQARARRQLVRPEPQYAPIEMPRNSPTGFITAFFAVVTGFALIWHIWWLVVLGLVGAYATFVVFAWRDVHEIEIPAEEVARIDRANRAARAAGTARSAGPMSTPALRVAQDPAFGPPEAVHRAVSGHGSGGPAPKRIVVGYGFWIFLLSDVIMFSAFFAAYAVLFKSTAGGPSAHELFDLHNTAAETGMPARLELHLWDGEPGGRPAQSEVDAGGAAGHRAPRAALSSAGGSRIRRLRRARCRPRPQRIPVVVLHAGRMPRGARERRAAVARHDDGAVLCQGVSSDIRHRFLCFSLFWHALDIIWVAIFSLVYLVGTLPPELLP